MTLPVKKIVNGTTVEQTQKLILYSMYEDLEERYREQSMAVEILSQKVYNLVFTRSCLKALTWTCFRPEPDKVLNISPWHLPSTCKRCRSKN